MRWLLFCVVVFAGCVPSPENTAQNTTDSISALATPEMLTQLGVVESYSDFGLINTPLLNELDTITLTFKHFACDCPSWDDTLHRFNYEISDTVSHINRYYYIEPATPNLEIPQPMIVNGNTFTFIGSVYKDLRYPENPKFMDPDPPKGKVFRYYSYRVIKPYTIWGPETFREIGEESGDSMFYSPTLRVE
jgi:hypothetical protein